MPLLVIDSTHRKSAIRTVRQGVRRPPRYIGRLQRFPVERFLLKLLDEDSALEGTSSVFLAFFIPRISDISPICFLQIYKYGPPWSLGAALGSNRF